ncbi:hypothetical protein E3N88_23190 [Mikania micrantha]|uniref:DUF4218 domain-containing protein n=1 Tax=Mikania micrantha TaxID=192012 RepID=A0A5N6NDQ9_9ASTR|nr:hypothetical protein E3N88_23190 [Mikania micrantha]
MSSRHSTWPVLLCNYNLPPWLCMKRKYIMMTLLIQGPKQPGNDIDVYLAPLIDDLKTLWAPGVDVYDAYKKENFILRAMIFCTISDFPAYGNLSGYSTKDVRHCLDVMHIEKNVCDSLLGLLLNIPGKTKDGINVRKDMVDMGIRKELGPIETINRIYLPPACYTPSKEEKIKFCKCLHDIKVPSNYSENIKKLVSMQDCKLLRMKSHDCHVLMTHMIPIAVRGILPEKIRHTITKLCLFFNMIHSKVIDPESLDTWQKEVILTLCELEMYFPPSFFDVMVHLITHIIGEIKACGPVFLRYMYPFERNMGFLKGYVRNRNKPEGKLEGVGGVGMTTLIPSRDELQLAHLLVLKHMTCLGPYVEEHLNVLRSANQGKDEMWYVIRHNKEFSSWMKTKVMTNKVDETVKRLGQGPDFKVKSYQGYDINGYTFYTEKQDQKSTMQNSGVTLIASTAEFDRADRSRMLRVAKDSYYGIIQEIWELDYYSFIMPVFKCKWVNNRTCVKVDNHGFTLVDLTSDGYASEPFVLAKQVAQVFYVNDPSKPRYHIVLQGKRRILSVDNVTNEDEYDHFDDLPPFSVGIQPTTNIIEGTTYLRSDHNEGIYVDKPRQTNCCFVGRIPVTSAVTAATETSIEAGCG